MSRSRFQAISWNLHLCNLEKKGDWGLWQTLQDQAPVQWHRLGMQNLFPSRQTASSGREDGGFKGANRHQAVHERQANLVGLQTLHAGWFCLWLHMELLRLWRQIFSGQWKRAQLWFCHVAPGSVTSWQRLPAFYGQFVHEPMPFYGLAL